MNATMIRLLMRKDLNMVRLPVLGYVLCGLLSVVLLGLENKAAFYAGVVLLITALVVLGVHPAISTVVHERKEGTLAFALSLPLSPRDYVWSKVLFNLLVYFVPWTVIMALTCGLFVWQDAIPDGLIPLTVILFSAIATEAVLILSVAVATESMEKTIGTMAACNLLFHGVFYGAGNAPGITATLHGPVAVWNGTVFAFLGAFLAISAASLALMFWRNSKKTDFI
jgi:ABC-2 type transport system permease protein